MPSELPIQSTSIEINTDIEMLMYTSILEGHLKGGGEGKKDEEINDKNSLCKNSLYR